MDPRNEDVKPEIKAEVKEEYPLNQDGGEADVTFYVGPRRVPFSGNKEFLASKSRLLEYALFQSPRVQGPQFKDDSQNRIYINIERVSPHAFKMMLKYLHSERVVWTPDLDRITEALALMKLAQELQIFDLVEVCALQVKGRITEENAPGLLETVNDLQNKELLKFILDFIAMNGRRILLGYQIKRISRECFAMILEMDRLNMAEISVLNAALRWAEFWISCRLKKDVKVTQTMIRAELGELLYLIRFPVMDMETFCRHVKLEQAGLLEICEELIIHRYLMGMHPAAPPFCTRPRERLPTAKRLKVEKE